MTTIAVGQLVEQNGTGGRVWQLISPDGPDHWNIRIHALGNDTGRAVGERSHCTVEWLEDRCHDWQPPRIEPPCGDGTQVVKLYDGPSAETRKFDTSAVMIEVITCFLEADHDRSIEWFGWDGDDTPDMTATCVDDEIVWAEV